MMHDRQTLLAEQAFLTARLAEIPAGARLTRNSAEARLRGITEQLSRLPANEQTTAPVRLTFKGKPVMGSQGIFADFATKAVHAFSEAVAAVAASLSAPLAAKGPIPNRDNLQLLITGTAVGSFGFELQEVPATQLVLDDQTTLTQALEQTWNLLQGATDADDELLADTAAGLDQRAIDKVRGFISTLLDYEALCTFQHGEHVFRFNDLGEVRTSLERLGSENLQETEQVYEGVFEGVLPKRRTFELRQTGSGEVLTGKLSPAILQPELINKHLYEPVCVSIMQTRVGNGRPRYTLLALPWLSPVTEGG